MPDLFWLLLPIAAASGWWVARHAPKGSAHQGGEPRLDYFKGLNYLLNEQPDKAIDVFIRLIEVDRETIETHLALGNLFRRRGETERAIRLHQNLIARQTLTREQRAQALLELGLDYLRAGLFDRAETLFRELADADLFREQALGNLRGIYELERDWRQCLEVTRQLAELSGRNLQAEIAHYHCELAEGALVLGQPAEALEHVQRALVADPNCVRAALLRGQQEMAEGQWVEALRTLKRIEHQDPAYLAEALGLLSECHQKLGRAGEWSQWLGELYRDQQGVALMLAETDLLEREEGKDRAALFLLERLQLQPDLRGLERLINLHRGRALMEKQDELLQIMQQLVRRLLDRLPSYQCGQCGFAARKLHWQCPSCKTWNSVKPVPADGMERRSR
ncbi:MAG: lipopolysaccharide assembly protein LapB [Pseudomonadota bacterium]